MRKLLLLRHAKSDWLNAGSDFDRPLATRGCKNAQQMGLWLAKQHYFPDYIITSTALRAQQTTRLVTEALANDVQHSQSDDQLYGASLKNLFRVLSQIPATYQRVLLVGHNPGFDQLLSYLADITDQLTNEGKLMTTCALAHLTMPDDWQQLSPGCAQLLELIRAKSLSL